MSLTPDPERAPGEGNGNPLQYSCLGNPMDRGAWWATVYGVSKKKKKLMSMSKGYKTNLKELNGSVKQKYSKNTPRSYGDLVHVHDKDSFQNSGERMA